MDEASDSVFAPIVMPGMVCDELHVGCPETVAEASDSVFAPIVSVPPIVRLVRVPRLVMLG